MAGTGLVQHRSYCRICPAQCGIVVTTDGERVVEVRGDDGHPRTHGYTCAKGRALPAFHHHALRLDAPRLEGAAVAWPVLLDDLAARLRALQETYGPDSIACYYGTWSWLDALGRRSAERFFRRIGTRSVYSALTVDAVARSYVAELMGGSSALIANLDPDATGLTILVGTNPVVSHGHTSALADPITALRRLAARNGLWVLDPRRTESARLATRHLAPRPGRDYVVLGYVLRELLAHGADAGYLREHAAGVHELECAVARFDRDYAAARSGLSEDTLDDLVAAVRAAVRFAVLTGTGITMSPQANVTEWFAWALQAVTGSFEREGGLWFNPGWFMRLDQGRIPRGDGTAAPGPASRPELGSRFGERPCAALADEIEAGHVRALFVLGGNPVTSLPDTARLTAALRRLDVLAVADVVEGPTVQLATHTLAVAGQLERSDTTYYVELYLGAVAAQYTAPVVPVGAARRPLWWVFDELSAWLHAAPAADGPFATREREMIEALAARSLGDHGGAFCDEIYRSAVEPRPRGWVAESVLPGGRWQLAPAPLVAQLDRLEAEAAERDGAGLVLVPRRVAHRMNSALDDLERASSRPADRRALVHPDDAARLGLRDGDPVSVACGTASIASAVALTADVRPGTVSVPHGLADRNVSALTSGAPGCVDELTGMVHQSGLMVTVRSATD